MAQAYPDTLKSKIPSWALTIQIDLAGPFTIYSGTMTVQAFWPSHSALVPFTPSLVSVGELLEDLAGGARPAFKFTLRNGIVSTSSGPMELTEAIRTRGVLGGRTLYTCWFKEDVALAGAAEEIILFVGNIYSFDVTQEGVTFRCADDDAEKVQIPIRTVAPNALLYGAREGRMPMDSAGSVVPIAYGRFDRTAVDRTYDGAALHFLNTFIPMLGVKHPMLPVVLMSNFFNYRETGSAAPTGIKSLLFAFGDTEEGSNNTEIALYAGGNADFNSPKFIADSLTATEDLEFEYTQLFTWDDETDEACPFVKDQSDHITDTASGKNAEKDYTCVWYPGKPTQHTGTGNTAANRQFQTFAVEHTHPLFTTAASEPEWWSGRTQSLALIPEKLSEYHGTTDTIVFGTTSGTVDPQNSMDRDLLTVCTFSGSNRLSLQMQAQGPRLGEVIAVRIVVIAGTSIDMACLDLRCAFRFHPQAGGVLANPTCEYNCAQVGATAVVQFVPTTTLRFFSFYIWRLPLLSTDMMFGHGPPQWEFIEMAGSPQQQWAGDLVLWSHDTNQAKVYSVWMEPIFRNNMLGMGAKKEGSQTWVRHRPWGGFASGGRRGDFNRGLPNPGVGAHMRFSNPNTQVWLVPYSGNVPSTEDQALGPQRVYATGTCTPFRSSSGRWKPGYTPATSAPIENPLSIALHSIDKYLGQYNNCEITNNAFGSFRNAIAHLESIGTDPAYRISVFQPERLSFREWLNVLGDHCRTEIVRHRLKDGSFLWRAFPQVTDPATTFPNNRWRSGAETIHPNNVFPDGLRVDFTSRDELRSRFVLRYGYHEPTGRFSYERMCNPVTNNLATQGSTYMGVLGVTETRYRDPVTLFPFQREDVLELPWLWFSEVADDLLKFHINAKRDRRVVVALTGDQNLLDVFTGHVVYLDDAFSNFLGNWPGLTGAATWSTHQMVVVSRNVAITRRGIEVELSLVEPFAVPV